LPFGVQQHRNNIEIFTYHPTPLPLHYVSFQLLHKKNSTRNTFSTNKIATEIYCMDDLSKISREEIICSTANQHLALTVKNDRTKE